MIALKLKVNPFEENNPMGLKDAAAVATVAAFATWILTFVAAATLGQIRADPAAFIFEAVKVYLVAWAGNFITLTGLTELVKRSEEKET